MTHQSPHRKKIHQQFFGRRLLVGVAVDAINKYGRQIIQGIHQYANVRREWLLHEVIRVSELNVRNWPKCEGAIFAGITPALTYKLARKTRAAMSCSSTVDPAVIPVVCADNAAIGRLAAEHLAERGLQHFAYYGPRDSTGFQRLTGFRSKLEALNFRCEVCPGRLISKQMWDYRHWPVLLAWIHSLPKPVGILTRDDSLGHTLAAACLNGGVMVPDQVAIVAVNNDEVFCDGAWPPLSSVEVDFSRIGYLAASQLDVLLKGRTIPPADRHLLVSPTNVVARLSTDIHLVDDPDLAMAIAYIREHGRTGCSVSDILNVVPVSRSWLERKFQEKLGRTPHDEIMRVRMEHARRLLMETDEPIVRVSERCGFHVVQNFNRTFTQRVGLSPFAFRRSHRA